jgi:hypothetical protein
MKNNLILTYKNLFDSNFCEEIIKFFNENSSLHESRNFNTVKTTLKLQDTFLPINYQNPIIEKFSSSFSKFIMPDYLGKNKIRNFHLLKLNPYHQIQKINPTEGKHYFYCERCIPSSSHLVLGYTLFLNDIEEGGELEFLNQSHRIKATQGSISLFPVGLTHLQRDNTPLQNVRYTMSGWLGYFN